MAKYLGKARYTAEGTRGLMKDGGSARVAAVTKLTKKSSAARSRRSTSPTASATRT